MLYPARAEGLVNSTITICYNDDATQSILRKCTGRCKLHRSQEKINHLMDMDEIKLFAKKWERNRIPNRGCEDIKWLYRDGKICHANIEKKKKTLDRRNRTSKSRKMRTPEEKANYKYLGILEADTIKHAEIKGKN